jgi:hypothetical protein
MPEPVPPSDAIVLTHFIVSVRRLAVTEPGNSPTPVSPQQGERYLRALPYALAGTRTRAILIDR